ncbi:hypothetical protein BDW42DRAFT_167441 [Aspergillus taichungensis]|uniref:Uncharacterized protein n=1 Tax=Aspergillus taichungensis TaxID=482145 RepID=A0A2J5HXM5_9EURO|nr:hypothetical protein BDW42DRAFT_167441 [Aspergillus taichungensis]
MVLVQNEPGGRAWAPALFRLLWCCFFVCLSSTRSFVAVFCTKSMEKMMIWGPRVLLRMRRMDPVGSIPSCLIDVSFSYLCVIFSPVLA